MSSRINELYPGCLKRLLADKNIQRWINKNEAGLSATLDAAWLLTERRTIP